MLLAAGASSVHAGEFHNALSLQGFTGLLNTPNAEVTGEGKFYAIYSDQKESQFRDRTAREDTYIFSVGLFPFTEIGGRLTDAPRVMRDLSANIKVKVPFIPKGYYLPDIAFGMQDVGGGVRFLQTKYAVATEEWSRIRVSLGYGTGPDRMKGVFGGVEVKAFDWLYLIGENDTKESNAGARLVSPGLFGLPMNLQLTAKTSLDFRPGRTMEYGFGLQVPLGSEHHNRTPVPEEKTGTGAGGGSEGGKGAAAAATPPPQPNTTPLTPAQDKNSPHPYPSPLVGEGQRERGLYRTEREKGSGGSSLEGLQRATPSPLRGRGPGRGGETSTPHVGVARLPLLLEKLTADGFQNVRVGARGEELLVVEYENSRYNYNELDGLGVVAGTVVDTIPSGFTGLKLVLKKHDIRVIELVAPLEDFRAFLRDPERYADFNHALRITTGGEADEGVTFIAGPGNPSWLRSSLIVYPALITYVGTEVGVFDYLLSAKLDYFLNAWKGAVINARWDVPMTWTENFSEGKAFGDTRKSSQFERLMLFQTIKASPGVMANLGAGMVLHNAYGTVNEVMWTPGEGTHRVRLKQAYISNRDILVQPQKNEVYLGSYRYYFSPLDLSLEGTGGKFLSNDKGFAVEIKRFFGDTAFSVFYRDARTPEQERVKVGGVMISLPLTLRRDMKPYLFQVRGSEDWSYRQETRIVSPGAFNITSTSIGIEPILAYNLTRVFYNRDRLSEQYIRKHLLRLRDAYMTYVNRDMERANRVGVK